MLTEKQFLIDCAQQFGVTIDDTMADKFSAYFDLVIESNKAFNLTAIIDERDFVLKHFVDSLAALAFISPDAILCDVGAGAGFPSIPIAIVRPDVQVTALDSTAKKMDFVLSSANTISVPNIKTVVGRAEEQTALFSTFDIVTARAVSALPVLLELCLPLLKTNGFFVAYKTDDSELSSVQNALTTLMAKLHEIKSFTLPNGDHRAIIVFQKIAPTPAPYPRQFGSIKKKPL